MSTSRVEIETYLDARDLKEVMRKEVRAGLSHRPKHLPPKYFYDERGSWLFERITGLDEYYLTRAERRLLDRFSGEIVELTQPEELLELGAGAALKTRLLLEAGHAAGSLRRYVPVDVSTDMAEHATERLTREYPWLEIRAVVADFERHLVEIGSARRRLVALLGSTIGNFDRERAVVFLRHMTGLIERDGWLLLGTDLVKDPAVLKAAYDDSEGVTADFNRNVLRVINEHLDADFDPEAFAHVAVYNAEKQRMEMHLEAMRPQRAWIDALKMQVDLEQDERIHTEVSCKYTRESVTALLAEAGLVLEHWFTDETREFALSLSRLKDDHERLDRP